MLVDYHNHLLGHLDRDITEENILKFLRAARDRGIKELGFSDHQRYYEEFNFELIREVAKQIPEVKAKMGVEINYIPGEEEKVVDYLAQFDLDYVIGSVHEIDDWVFDHPDYKDGYEEWNMDELYEKYFKYIERAVKSELFDILGHLDLIKVFDFRPDKDVLEIITPTLEVIADYDQVIEINTNGLNKPAGEIYPSRRILERAYEVGVKVTLGSDAHRAERVGENLAEVRKMLKEIGYKEIATFTGRERKMVKL